MTSVTDQDLPPEMLQMIFSFCNVSDLLNSVQYVCKKWRESVLSPLVWKNKTLRISGHDDMDELKSLLIELPFLKNVDLVDMSSEGISLLCDNCPSIQEVQFTHGDPQVLLNLTPRLTCLSSLDICFQRCFKLEVAFQECAFNFTPLLSTVVFRSCTTDGTVPLALLNSCHLLEHLVVSLGLDIEEIVKSSLKETNSSQKTAGKHNMRTIYLCGAILCDKDILNAISLYPNLQYLALKHNLFDDSQVLGTIFKQSQPNIVFLDLSYSFKLTADAIIAVINACPNVKFLSLMRSLVDNRTLAFILNTLNKVQYLNLHGTLITSQLFFLIPKKLPNLTDLNICACRKIDQHILNELVNSMPNLSIIHPRRGYVRGANVSERPHPFIEQRNFLYE